MILNKERYLLCADCKKWLHESKFYIDNAKKSKRRPYCKKCDNERRIEHINNNREYYNDYNRERYESGSLTEWSKEYYQKNRKRIRAAQAEYYRTHKEQFRKRKREWYLKKKKGKK